MKLSEVSSLASQRSSHYINKALILHRDHKAAKEMGLEKASRMDISDCVSKLSNLSKAYMDLASAVSSVIRAHHDLLLSGYRLDDDLDM